VRAVGNVDPRRGVTVLHSSSPRECDRRRAGIRAKASPIAPGSTNIVCGGQCEMPALPPPEHSCMVQQEESLRRGKGRGSPDHCPAAISESRKVVSDVKGRLEARDVVDLPVQEAGATAQGRRSATGRDFATVAVEQMVTVKVAATLAATCEETVRRAIWSGQLKADRIGRSIRIRESALTDWIRRGGRTRAA
jgi:excisionase family DNA binding protein